jgi:hypothetical protein
MKGQPMQPIYIPTTSADDWKNLLADPKKHWRKGYSARTLAYSWQSSNGFPDEIAKLFSSSSIAELINPSLILAIPEHKVCLPPLAGHPSQNDLFALGKVADGNLISITIEGKVSESFDKTVGEWLKPISPGKTERLQFLQSKLGLINSISPEIRYQLLHRLASAILEAERFNAKYAVMIVHSFSQENEWYGDFENFLGLFSAKSQIGELTNLTNLNGIQVCAGWVRGAKRFLAA